MLCATCLWTCINICLLLSCRAYFAWMTCRLLNQDWAISNHCTIWTSWWIIQRYLFSLLLMIVNNIKTNSNCSKISWQFNIILNNCYQVVLFSIQDLCKVIWRIRIAFPAYILKARVFVQFTKSRRIFRNFSMHTCNFNINLSWYDNFSSETCSVSCHGITFYTLSSL